MARSNLEKPQIPEEETPQAFRGTALLDLPSMNEFVDPNKMGRSFAYTTILGMSTQEAFERDEEITEQIEARKKFHGTGGTWEEEEPRNPIAEIAASIERGGYGTVENYLRAGRVLGLDTTERLHVIKKMSTGLEPSRKGVFWDSVNGGFQSTVESVLAGVPGAGAGFIAGTTVPLIGNAAGAVVGFAAGAGGLFTLAEYDRFLEEAEELGLKREDLTDEALLSAVAEGGIEAITDFVALKTFGLIGKNPAVKTTLTQALGRFLGRIGKVGSVEIPGEMATSAIQTKQRIDAGIIKVPEGKTEEEVIWESMKQAIGPSVVQTILMGGLGQVSATVRDNIGKLDITDKAGEVVDVIIRPLKGEEGAISFGKDKDPEALKKEVFKALEENKIVPLEILEQFKGEAIVDEAIAIQTGKEIKVEKPIKPKAEPKKPVKEVKAEPIEAQIDKAIEGKIEDRDIEFITVKPPVGRAVKKSIREITGQVRFKGDKLVKEFDALTGSIKKEVQVARQAFKAGKTEEAQKSKKRIADLTTKLRDKFNANKERIEVLNKLEIQSLKKKGEEKLLRQRINDRLSAFGRGIKEGTISTKKQVKAVQTEIVDILDASELEAKDKAKFIKTIKGIQTKEQLERRMPIIQERIDKLNEAAKAREFRSKIKKTLKRTKPKALVGKPKGKFTAEVQRVLDSLRMASKLNQSDAETQIYQNIDRFPEGQIPFEIARENKIIAMLSGLEKRSSAEYESLLNEIEELIEKGTMIAELRRFNIETQVIEKREFIKETVTGGKGLPEGIETTGPERKRGFEKFKQEARSFGRQFVLSYHDLLGTLAFNTPQDANKMKKEFNVRKQEQEYKVLQSDYIDDFNKQISKAYNIKNSPLDINRKIIENNQIVDDLGTFVNATGNKVTIQRTRDELIKRWMEMQDPTLEESLIEGNKFTPEILNAIENKLTEQDKAWGRAQLGMYRRQYDKVNEVYRVINGIDLPFNLFYSPIRREGFTVDITKGFGEFLDEASYRNAVTSRSLITRTKNLLPVTWQGSTEVLNRHMSDSNYYIAWVEKVRELDAVFKDGEVKASIEQEFGRGFLPELFSHLDDFSTNRNNKETNKAADWFRKNYAIGKLMIKPALTIKQLVSTFAYMEVLTPSQLTVGIADFLKSPLKNLDILRKESDFFRLRGADMERDIKAAIGTDDLTRYSVKNTFTNMAMMNVRLGDKGAIALGAWSMRKAGFTVDEYETFSLETQQSADSGQLSNVQKGGSFAKLFTMFMSSQRSYLAKELNAITSLFTEGGTSAKNITKVARTLGIYHIVLPVMFQFVVNFGGTDEDDIKEYIRAGILGSLNGLFIFGQIIDSAVRALLKMRIYDPSIPILSVLDDVVKAIKKLRVDDITDKEVMEAVELFLKSGSSFGLPTEQALNMSKGVGDLHEGNIKQGVGGLLGWSEFHLRGDKTAPQPTRRLKE